MLGARDGAGATPRLNEVVGGAKQAALVRWRVDERSSHCFRPPRLGYLTLP